MKTIEETFTEIFMYLGVPGEQVSMEASLSTDFGFGELHFSFLALFIKICFDLNIEEKDLVILDTVGNVIDLVKMKIEAQH